MSFEVAEVFEDWELYDGKIIIFLHSIRIKYINL